MRRGLLIVVTIFFYMLIFSSSYGESSSGKYLDDLVLRDTGDGRDFELYKQFRYVDPHGITWVVPKATRVNGASIPQALWGSIIGCPWEGRFRRASVIHDYFFDEKRYDSASVHRVFYDAMITDGVTPAKAKLFYWAVVRFNDEWQASGAVLPSCGKNHPSTMRCLRLPDDETLISAYNRVSVDFIEDEFKEAQKMIDEAGEELSPEQLASNALEKRNKQINKQ